MTSMSWHQSEGAFVDLQTAWRDVAGQVREIGFAMRSKYGIDGWRTYATKSEQSRYEVRDRAERRASERMYRWLDAHSPNGDRWRSGVSCIFVRECLTYEQATAEHPVLPARALGYGRTRRDVWFEVAS